jgi:hypothetical protein
MARYLSVFFDVEDPFNELADDAAIDLTKICTSLGIRGSFCITGEKCRVLKRRGRVDVFEALAPHAMGYHTNTHSVHPTTMELLEYCGWDDGCAAIYDAERPGVDAFYEAFGRSPVCWGGAGFTWGPQVAGVLDRLEIPSYVYSRTVVPGMVPHRFVDRLAMPHHGFVLEEELESGAKTRLAYFRSKIQFQMTSSPWLGFFAGHPTRMRYKEFWDRCYHGGVNPTRIEPVTPKSPELYQRCLANLKWILGKLAKEYTIIGIDEAVSMAWQFEPLPASQLCIAEEKTIQRLERARKWPVHKPDLNIDSIKRETLLRLPLTQIATGVLTITGLQ